MVGRSLVGVQGVGEGAGTVRWLVSAAEGVVVVAAAGDEWEKRSRRGFGREEGIFDGFSCLGWTGRFGEGKGGLLGWRKAVCMGRGSKIGA